MPCEHESLPPRGQPERGAGCLTLTGKGSPEWDGRGPTSRSTMLGLLFLSVFTAWKTSTVLWCRSISQTMLMAQKVPLRPPPFLWEEEERPVVGLGRPRTARLPPPVCTCCLSPPGWDSPPGPIPLLMQMGPRGHLTGGDAKLAHPALPVRLCPDDVT